jgi:hypothetical protein
MLELIQINIKGQRNRITWKIHWCNQSVSSQPLKLPVEKIQATPQWE